MEKTQKEYYRDAYEKEFEAKVVSVEKDEKSNNYKVVLDATIFFPEGGGQSSDKGTLGEANVIDVKEKDGIIYHIVDKELKVNENVLCQIDWDKRYDKMQNHSAEHVLSGLIHEKFGYNNVGFHLSDDNVVTFDFDGTMTEEDMKEIETRANEIILENVPITATIYNGDELKDLEYRAKLDLTEDVRIVRIGDYDACACCAPHVKSTIEIGLVKILKMESYKGGERFYMLAGKRAYEDYKAKHDIIDFLSKDLSATLDDLICKYEKKIEEIEKVKNEKNEIKNKLYDMIVEKIDLSKDKIYFITDGLDANDLREIGNKVMEKTDKIISLFSKAEDKTFYVICSSKEDTKDFVKELNTSLNGKGGGKPNMATGSVTATKEEIEIFLKK